MLSRRALSSSSSVVDPDAKLTDFRDLRLQSTSGIVNGSDVDAFESETATLIDAKRVDIVVGREQP